MKCDCHSRAHEVRRVSDQSSCFKLISAGSRSNSFAQNKKGTMITHDAFNATTKFVVGRAGFEPATNGLKVRCSTS